jgi:hypothetical protein
MLVEKYLLKNKDIEGEAGNIKMMDAINRTTESLYALSNNNITFIDNMSAQIWEVEWHGNTYPKKKVDKNKLKSNPIGLIMLSIKKDGTSVSLSNPAWVFESDTIEITDITGIVVSSNYKATFLIV